MDYVYSREKGEDKTQNGFMLLVINEQKKNFPHYLHIEN